MTKCVRVPRAEGEAVRRKLAESGLLDTRYRIVADCDSILIPVLSESVGYRVTEGNVPEKRRIDGDYRKLLEGKEWCSLLPSSFDVVGDVGIIKLPDTLLPYAEEIGGAMMTANRSLRCVFADRGVKGEHRVRDVVRIAGEGTSETVHTEFGARIRVDIASVYFNPRLAGERRRVALLVSDGETVIDMFAGAAPFGVQICRHAKPKAVYSVDLNPVAGEYAKINAEKNRATGLIPLTGDARDIVPTLPMADRIIMNLPQTADSFLPLALSRLKHGGTVHMYKITERSEVDSLTESIRAMHTAVAVRELKTYSPSSSVFVFDIVKEAPDLVRLYDADGLQVSVHRYRAQVPHSFSS